jgi:hypothetical protein
MVGLVETMLNPSTRLRAWLHENLPKAKTPHERESIERTIAATDRAIAALVYELYGLTEEEIMLVEGGQK